MTTLSGPVTADEFGALWQLGLASEDGLRDRSIQSSEGITGASDIGVCRERTRLNVTQAPRTDSDNSSAATVGNYIHEGALTSYGRAFPHVLIEQAVTITLPSGAVLPGHADIIDPTEPSATDLKTVDGIEFVRKHGATDQQRIQRTLYALGAHQAGLFGDTPLEQVITRNVWVDRSGGTSDVHVDQELFDMQWVFKADEWLSDVIYAVEHGEAASKDKPLTFCQSYCPFFSGCRGSDVAPDALITDPELVAAARTYKAAHAEMKRQEQLKKEAGNLLAGVDGQAGDLRVRHVWINPSHVEYDKVGHYRLEVKPVVVKK